jgi:hypothetical protein
LGLQRFILLFEFSHRRLQIVARAPKRALRAPLRYAEPNDKKRRHRKKAEARYDLNGKGIRGRNEVEPISKSFEEHNEAGKLDKAEEIVGVVLPTNEDPALPLKPGEEALDEPASHVAA